MARQSWSLTRTRRRTPVRPRPRSTNNMMKVDVPTQLAKLDELRTKGAIDDEEFAIAKAKVLHLP